MAKRKKRRSYARIARAAKPMAVLLSAGAYGAVREKISNALMPVTSKIPLGNIADEVTLFGAGYLLQKNVRNKLVKEIAQAGMVVEAARIGEAAINNEIGLSSSGASVSSAGFASLG